MHLFGLVITLTSPCSFFLALSLKAWLIKALNKLLENRKYRLLFNLTKDELTPDNYKKETDLIIVHKKCGIILVEVKSNIKGYEEAQEQLDKTENLLYDEHLSKYFKLDPMLKNSVIKKVIACPCHNENEKEKRHKAGYIELFKNHVTTYKRFSKWWHANILTTFVEWWKCCNAWSGHL